MPSITQIRAALSDGPATPSEVAEKLGATSPKERQAVYQALNQAITKERGIERLDGGKVTLVPGWKPTRGAAPGKAKRTKAKTPKGRGGRNPGRAASPPPTPQAPDAGPDPEPGPGTAVQVQAEDVVRISRRHLRLLVAHALVYETENFPAEMKQAVATGAILSL